MVRSVGIAAVAVMAGAARGFVVTVPPTQPCRATAARTRSISALSVVPLELEGQLNTDNKWEVELSLDSVTKKITINEGTSVLEAAEMAFGDPPFSCRNGVCTTCAGLVEAGEESITLAVHGLGKPQREAGFTLTCQTFPTGPGVKVTLNKYDEVYEDQYGQFEKGTSKEGNKPKKLLGFLG